MNLKAEYATFAAMDRVTTGGGSRVPWKYEEYCLILVGVDNPVSNPPIVIDYGVINLASCASEALSSETAIQPLRKPKPSVAKSRGNFYDALTKHLTEEKGQVDDGLRQKDF